MNDRTIMTRIDQVAHLTQKEEERQDERWGRQDHPDGTGPTPTNLFHRNKAQDLTKKNFANGVGTWRDILTEEVTEAFAEEDSEKLKEELIQVAAVAQQWVRAIERRQEWDQMPTYEEVQATIPPEEYMPVDLDDEMDMRL